MPLSRRFSSVAFQLTFVRTCRKSNRSTLRFQKVANLETWPPRFLHLTTYLSRRIYLSRIVANSKIDSNEWKRSWWLFLFAFQFTTSIRVPSAKLYIRLVREMPAWNVWLADHRRTRVFTRKIESCPILHRAGDGTRYFLRGTTCQTALLINYA